MDLPRREITNSKIKEKKRMTLRIKNTEVGFENYTWIGKKRRISFTRQRDEKVEYNLQQEADFGCNNLAPLVWEEGRVLEQIIWKFTEAIFCTEK